MVRTLMACLALAATLCPAGCAPAVKVRTAWTADPSAVRTYAWQPGEGDIAGVYGSRAAVARDAIREAVEDGLKQNGLRPAPQGEADVLVVYQLGVRSRREVTDLKTVQRNGETYDVPADVTIYRGGTIIIYLVDRLRDRVVWVGTASAEAKAADSDSTARARITRAVRAVFDDMKKGKRTEASAGA